MRVKPTDSVPRMQSEPFDVVVIGGGPAGASASYGLASRGHSVLCIEKAAFPRAKTCGDGLTPRALGELFRMGIDAELERFPRCDGLRSHAYGKTLELPWPKHPIFPSYGRVVPRFELDALVLDQAAAAGSTVWFNAEATEVSPVKNDILTVHIQKGAEKLTVRARYAVVADGAKGRIGRSLGVTRDRSYPLGQAKRGYWQSTRADSAFLESYLDIRDEQGRALPAYGWVFPLGQGRLNIGAGFLTSDSGRTSNTNVLLDRFVERIADEWKIDPASGKDLHGGRLPTGLSVTPTVQDRLLFCGDAMGAINPFNGEGISYAYQTGRIAASTLDQALRSHDPLVLTQFAHVIEEELGLYYRTARAFVRIASHPPAMRAMTMLGFQNRTLMEWVLRIMSNLLRPDEHGPAEIAYGMCSAIIRRTRV